MEKTVFPDPETEEPKPTFQPPFVITDETNLVDKATTVYLSTREPSTEATTKQVLPSSTSRPLEETTSLQTESPSKKTSEPRVTESPVQTTTSVSTKQDDITTTTAATLETPAAPATQPPSEPSTQPPSQLPTTVETTTGKLKHGRIKLFLSHFNPAMFLLLSINK